MRPGPKFEITKEMAIANMQTVFHRIQPEALTSRLYGTHGSFSIRAIQRKWKWEELCKLAGIPFGISGRKKQAWHPCKECDYRLAVGRFCHECRRTMKRRSRGALYE